MSDNADSDLSTCDCGATLTVNGRCPDCPDPGVMGYLDSRYDGLLGYGGMSRGLEEYTVTLPLVQILLYRRDGSDRWEVEVYGRMIEWHGPEHYDYDSLADACDAADRVIRGWYEQTYSRMEGADE